MKKLVWLISLLVLIGCSNNEGFKIQNELYLDFIDSGFNAEIDQEASIVWIFDDGYMGYAEGEVLKVDKDLNNYDQLDYEKVRKDVLSIYETAFDSWDRSIDNTFLKHPVTNVEVSSYGYYKNDNYCIVKIAPESHDAHHFLNGLICVKKRALEYSKKYYMSLFEDLYKEQYKIEQVLLKQSVDNKYFHVVLPRYRNFVVKKIGKFEIVYEGKGDKYNCEDMFSNSIPRSFYDSECYFIHDSFEWILSEYDHDNIDELVQDGEDYYSAYKTVLKNNKEQINELNEIYEEIKT